MSLKLCEHGNTFSEDVPNCFACLHKKLAGMQERLSTLQIKNEHLRSALDHIDVITDAVMSETEDPGGCGCAKCSQPGVKEARRQLKEIESLRAQLTAAQAENERLAAGLLHISDTTDDPELAQWAFRYINGSAGIAAKEKRDGS